MQGVGGTQGVATVEVYDLSPNNGAILANISTRGFIQTGDNVMIGGFIVVEQASKVLIRATGPSLIPFGINNALANPRLELHDANGTLAGNDDWQTTQLGGIITSDQSAAIQNSGLAPGDPAESAIIATLGAGSYTAIAQGVNGGTGVGLVEVFCTAIARSLEARQYFHTRPVQARNKDSDRRRFHRSPARSLPSLI